jgi:hypothetical protein
VEMLKQRWLLCLTDSFRRLSVRYARVTGRCIRYITTLDDIERFAQNESYENVLIAGNALSISALGLDQLSTIFGGNVAFLTASNVEAYARLIERIIDYRPNRPIGRAYSTVDFTPICESDVFSSYSLALHPDRQIKELTEMPVTFLAFIGHGRSYCALAGNLCSRNEAAEKFDRRCVGDYECVFAEHARIPASDLLASIVFVDSCSTSSFRNPGPEVEERLNLSIHLISGNAVAVIASWRTNTIRPLAPFLLWTLAEEELTLGQIVSRMNQYSTQRASSAGPYILLGDPDMRVFRSETKKATGLLKVLRTSYENTWAAQVSTDVPISRWIIDDRELCAAAKEAPVYCFADNGPSGAELSTELLNQSSCQGSLEVLLVPSRRVKSDQSVTLFLTTRAPFQKNLLDHAELVCRNVDFELTSLSENIAREAATALKNMLDEVYVFLSDCSRNFISSAVPPLTLREYATLRHLESKVIERCAELQISIYNAVVSRARSDELWMYSAYGCVKGVRVLDDRIASDLFCPHCGGTLSWRRYQVGMTNARTRRLYECEACMYVCDVPDGVGFMYISTNDATLLGHDVGFTVRCLGTQARVCYVGVVIDRMGGDQKAISILPTMVKLESDANGDCSADFTLNASTELCPHLYHVKAIACVNGSIWWAIIKSAFSRDEEEPSAGR